MCAYRLRASSSLIWKQTCYLLVSHLFLQKYYLVIQVCLQCASFLCKHQKYYLYCLLETHTQALKASHQHKLPCLFVLARELNRTLFTRVAYFQSFPLKTELWHIRLGSRFSRTQVIRLDDVWLLHQLSHLARPAQLSLSVYYVRVYPWGTVVMQTLTLVFFVVRSCNASPRRPRVCRVGQAGLGSVTTILPHPL